MGFDPRGVKHYYLTLKWEAQRRSRRGDCSIDVGRLRTAWNHGSHCHCHFDMGTAPVEVDYEFLSYTDIIESYFRKGLLLKLYHGIHAAFMLFFSGLFFKFCRHTWPFALFSAFPVVTLVLGTLLSLILGGTLDTLATDAGAPAWLGKGLHLIPLAAFLYAISRWDDRIFVLWILNIFSFIDETMHGRHPELDQRLGQFADRLEEVLRKNDCDEVIVASHSSGTLLAISITSEVIRRLQGINTPKLCLLTMGGQHNLAFHPEASRLRQEMRELAETPSLLWIDVFAPQDPITAGRFDPVKHLGLQPRERHNPHLVTARFPEVLPSEVYRRVRYSFFRHHFQFLMANETGKGFDYFRVLGSPIFIGSADIGALPALPRPNR